VTFAGSQHLDEVFVASQPPVKGDCVRSERVEVVDVDDFDSSQKLRDERQQAGGVDARIEPALEQPVNEGSGEPLARHHAPLNVGPACGGAWR
jgi:hypothetical protein